MKDKFIYGLIIGFLVGLWIGTFSSYRLFDRYQISQDGRTKIDKISGESWKLKYSNGDPFWENIN